MWKKDEGTPAEPESKAAARSESPRREPAKSERATIGRSITIRGEVSGDEDLLIQGEVDGSVDLELHAVTVGAEGRVKANITGRVVTVEGKVEGDLKAQEQVILRTSAQVKGDITAPRVVLEDGASFRGLVDMGAASERDKPAVDQSASRTTQATSPTQKPDAEISSTSSEPSGTTQDKRTSPPSTKAPSKRMGGTDKVDKAAT